MPTPSIQTLRNDAQQVLNLDSISAVRSVVAATLANANAGTPLNPNLTTQQLWNEFYQIVTQPKSDIESIIANQLMKFLYAPPAPGGVGANKQVIFNDGGVLAGDAGLTYDKATDSLTVGNSIGIREAAINGIALLSAVTTAGMPATSGTTQSAGSLRLTATNTTGCLDIGTAGAVSWLQACRRTNLADNFDLVLNPNGGNVGIGVASPLYQLHVAKVQSSQTAIYVDNQQNNAAASSALTLSAYGGFWNLSVPHSATFVNPLIFKFGSTEMMRMTSVGDIVLAGGNTSANGVGITFPATQVASSDANTLDDYEEGTFTPIIQGSTSAGTGTYAQQIGYYTKVGRLVTVNFYLVWSAHTGTGLMRIGGLPFITANLTSSYSSATFGLVDNIALNAGAIMTGFTELNSNYINLYQYPSGGGVSPGVSMDTAGGLLCNLSYIAA